MAGELTKFLEQREESYKRLDDLLKSAGRHGLKRFDRDQLIELGHLYRIAAADLARARFVLRSPVLTEYLNDLVGRAHHVIHRRKRSVIKSFARFIIHDFPSAVRAEYKIILFSMAILIAASIVGGIAYSIDDEWGQLVLSQPAIRQYERALEDQPAGLAAAIETEMMPAASAYIISNNIRVCIVAAAGGVLFGIGTLFALLFNGFLLGVIGTMFLGRGGEYSVYFWAGVLPHGVIEIPAICIAAAAGFLFARALLIPGNLTRGDALRRAGRNAMTLLGGVLVLLIFAGLIEGFITPIPSNLVPSFVKILFSIILLGFFIFYLVRSGTRESQDFTSALRTTTHLRLD